MTRALLVLWMALVGAVRLDLAGGSLSVVLSPFLVLTPVVICALALRRYLKARPVAVEWPALTYLLFVSLFFVAVGTSTLVSLDADSTLARAALLIIQFGGATAVALLLHDDEQAIDALRTGAMLGVALFVVLDVLQVFSFLGVLPHDLAIGPASLRLDTYGYGGIIPRLSGLAIDPNNAGLILLIYAFLAPRTRVWAVLLLLLTLSRSAVLGALALGAVAAWQFGVAQRAAPTRRLLFGVMALGVGLVALARTPIVVENATRLMAPFAERFSGGVEGSSAADHEELLIRAAEEGSQTVQRATFGIGWGAANVVLQDIFPGNRYGNFHTLYGTAFAEAGVFALIALLVLLFVPLTRATEWRPAVAGFIAFNLFYQATTEPAFWLLLALAWVARSARPAAEGALA